MSIDLAELLAPISADRPCGEDIGFDDVFDHVREARRADDPSLGQGEWQTELKVADWRLVVRLATDVLANRSKDLQMAVWLGEALIATEGVSGARQGMELLHGLMDGMWDDLYPELDGDDAEERAAKLAWFNIYASDALRRVPLSMAGGAKPMNLLLWQDSREVDNLARQSQEAYDDALAEGRITGETFDKAMLDSPGEAVLRLLEDSKRALEAFEQLKVTADERLGHAAPSLASIEDALKRIRQIVAKTVQEKGIGDAAPEEPSALPSLSGGHDEAGAAPLMAAGRSGGGPALDLSQNSAASKEAALSTIRDIAAFFRRTEPHNPVAFMLEKAVVWADMPLDTWLNEVVRDSSVLSSIRDRVGIPED